VNWKTANGITLLTATGISMLSVLSIISITSSVETMELMSSVGLDLTGIKAFNNYLKGFSVMSLLIVLGTVSYISGDQTDKSKE
jgi:hypothetical protein